MCVNYFRRTETVASKNASTNKQLSARKVTVTVSHNGSLHVEVPGKQLSKGTTSALSILDSLSKDASSRQKVQLIDKLKVCCGIPELTLLELADKRGNVYSVRKSGIAKIEGKTIRHVNCVVLIQEGTRCGACSAYKRSLMVKRSRQRRRIEGEHKVYPCKEYLYIMTACLCISI